MSSETNKPKINYRYLFKDIINGYSEVEHSGKKFFVKHLSALDQVDLEVLEEKFFDAAKKRGVPTKEEALERLKEELLWSEEDESKIKEQKDFIDGVQKSRKQLFLKSDIDLNNYIIDKYGSYSKAYEVRYYETLEIKSQDGTVLVPAGLKVSSQYIDFNETILVYQGTNTFDPITDEEILEEVEVPNPNYLQLVPTFFTYFDSESGKDVTYNQVIKEVSNYEYEVKLNEEKRQIFALKKEYLNVILDQIEENLAYKKGSKQFVSESLKRGSTVEFED